MTGRKRTERQNEGERDRGITYCKGERMTVRKKRKRDLLSAVSHGDRVGGRPWLSFRPCKSAAHS